MLDRLGICSAAAVIGSLFAVTAFGQDFTLRTTSMGRSVEAVMSGYKFCVDHDLFMELMPETIENEHGLDSLQRVELQRRVISMGNAGISNGITHFSLEGKWKSLFERLLARCVNFSDKVYIIDEQTGQVVAQLWRSGQSSSHGVSWGKYYADEKRRKKVFSYRWNCRC